MARPEVTRHLVGSERTTAPYVTPAKLIILPVPEEVVVQKQLLLKEKLHVRRRVETEAVEVPVSLRKQRAIVERVARDGSTVNEEETDP